MLFDKITPEEAGISSAQIAEYIDFLERHECNMHSVLMMRGDKLFAEYYWAPFDRDFCHRMYSQTKSYVGIAIGLLLEEGKLSLDDTIVSYFPEKIEREVPPYLARQTIRDMLMMCTCGTHPSWFTGGDPDRTHWYLNNISADHPSGTTWKYDSTGSQVLCSLVEKLSGMRLLEYLKAKIFDKIGTFKTAEVLRCANGDSWGDSALLCTSRDMASCARFLLNYGTWNGERLMSEAYLREATSPLSDNSNFLYDETFSSGYGYKIWCTEDGGFAFSGMGDQYTIMLPEKDLIFVCTADNQGYTAARHYIVDGFFEKIVHKMANKPLAADAAAEKMLADRTANLRLITASGEKTSPLSAKISGQEYVCDENPTGITRFRFDFTENGGVFSYTNAQGDKEIPFGMCENVFAKFPQLGYSNDFGSLRTTDGFMYDAAFSAAWRQRGQRLLLRVQIIDRYFGTGMFFFTFKGDEVHVHMQKQAEDFLNEYTGMFVARKA